MTREGPRSAVSAGRRVYRCPNGHEVTRLKGVTGRPVCQVCTTSPDDLVFMDQASSPGSR